MQDNSAPISIAQAFPAPLTHRIADVLITFNPLVVKNLSLFANAIKPIMQDARLDELFSASVADNNTDAAVLIEDMASEYAPQLIQALSVVSDVDTAWLGNQPIDTLIALAQKAVEVNRDYFLPRVAPRLIQAVIQQQTGAQSAGDLLPQATDTATLPTTP